MHPKCPCCGQNFEPEPGYYYGAMYVSFAIGTGIFLAVLLVLNFMVKEITLPMVMTAVLVITFGFLPGIFRISRAVWINLFIHYEDAASRLGGKL